MVNCHIKKYLIIFFVLVQGAVAFSCASDDEGKVEKSDLTKLDFSIFVKVSDGEFRKNRWTANVGS